MLPVEEAWRISGEGLFTEVRGSGILGSPHSRGPTPMAVLALARREHHRMPMASSASSVTSLAHRIGAGRVILQTSHVLFSWKLTYIGPLPARVGRTFTRACPPRYKSSKDTCNRCKYGHQYLELLWINKNARNERPGTPYENDSESPDDYLPYSVSNLLRGAL